MRPVLRRVKKTSWLPGLVAFAGILAIAVPVTSYGQERSRDRGGSSRDSDRRGSSGQSDRRGSNRDDDRRGSTRDDDRRGSTKDDDRRGTSGSDAGRRRDDTHVQFTHSQEGRRFDNGVTLRRGVTISDRRLDRYFPHHYYSYPHYATTRVAGSVVISPFSFYFGAFPPYIERSHVFFTRPSRVFIEVVVGGGRSDDYYLSRRPEDTRWRNDPELRRAVYDLEDAFKNEDISLLAPLTDPQTRIAIFARGHYEYTLDPNDYLDMTRDFMRSVRTIDFEAFRVHYRAPGVYQVFAKHVFRDPDGQSKVVNLCMVIERIEGRWTLTQIDSTPEGAR